MRVQLKDRDPLAPQGRLRPHRGCGDRVLAAQHHQEPLRRRRGDHPVGVLELRRSRRGPVTGERQTRQGVHTDPRHVGPELLIPQLDVPGRLEDGGGAETGPLHPARRGLVGNGEDHRARAFEPGR